MTTAAELISEARSLFYSGQRDNLTTLTAAENTTDTSIVLVDETNTVQRGSVLSVDLEEMLVTGYTAASKTATVIRGWNGSTAADHLIGAVVWVNPRVSDFRILRAINNELRSLSAQGLYRVATKELTYSSVLLGYDLAGVTSIDEIMRVRLETTGPEDDWVDLARNTWRLQRNQAVGDFSSTFALKLLSGGDQGRAVTVVYKQPFGTLAALADTAETTAGFPTTAVDILSLGAAIRVAEGREIARNFSDAQGDTRRADEVPPGAANQAPAGLRQRYRQRVGEEAARLVRQYGV